MRPLTGKVAWITGAGSGIGQACAVELGLAGAHVVVTGRRAEMLEETRAKIAAAGGAVEKLALDVADRRQVEHGAHAMLERLGRCDILVNSAGINVAKRFYRELAAEDWDRVIAINLNGALYCMLAVLPGMRERRDGLVVNIASWLGRWPAYLGGAAYAATKHAMASMTHQLNIEEGVHGIRGCVVYPGEVATPILKNRPVPPSAEEQARMLQAEDLGRAVRFVAESPPHVCINELVITPTWNRLLVGGEDIRLTPPRP
jgi:NADP-dependent 3-hydroxy acid dehydrogenase YdfG